MLIRTGAGLKSKKLTGQPEPPPIDLMTLLIYDPIDFAIDFKDGSKFFLFRAHLPVINIRQNTLFPPIIHIS